LTRAPLRKWKRGKEGGRTADGVDVRILAGKNKKVVVRKKKGWCGPRGCRTGGVNKRRKRMVAKKPGVG